MKHFGSEIQARSASEWVIARDPLARAACLYWVIRLSKCHSAFFLIQARSASEWVIAATMDSLAGASCLYFRASALLNASQRCLKGRQRVVEVGNRFFRNDCCRRCAARSTQTQFRGLAPTAKRCRRYAARMPTLPGVEVRFCNLVQLK